MQSGMFMCILMIFPFLSGDCDIHIVCNGIFFLFCYSVLFLWKVDSCYCRKFEVRYSFWFFYFLEKEGAEAIYLTSMS